MAVTRALADAGAASWQDPPVGGPLIGPGVQLFPAAAVQAVMGCWPGALDRSAAVNPTASAVSAATVRFRA